MKTFMNENFLLTTPQARRLYQDCAAGLPIVDFHNHLSAQEIYEDKTYENLTQVWLGGDHYKWRLMRSFGIDECYITGDAADKEKYDHFVYAVCHAYGNPLYHWTHLELWRYFGIDAPLTMENKDEIWERCAKILKGGLSVREMLRRQKVEVLCTTNDPLEDLRYHKLLKDAPFSVLPTFRPDRALKIAREDFADYINELLEAAGKTSPAGRSEVTVAAVAEALSRRLDVFENCGCVISDHSLEDGVFAPCDEREAGEILARRLSGEVVSPWDALKYQTYMLLLLAKMYRRRKITMQLHIGALRDNSPEGFASLGADAGFDSMNDRSFAKELSQLLGTMEASRALPRTIIYVLNPVDYPMAAAMAGNFSRNAPGRGYVQTGAAWWFNDHLSGIREQLMEFARNGALGNFVGMLTDSRSFLSFPRHEYFRRILCQLLGEWMARGEIPEDFEACQKLITDICYENARKAIDKSLFFEYSINQRLF